MNFEISWQQDSMNFYYHGSRVTYNESSIIFENRLLPPGMSIVNWSSKSMYQVTRKTLELPLLKRENKYHIQINASSTPKDKFFVLITFFDRYDNKVGSKAIKGKQADFIYPKSAFSYKIELVNKGIQKLKFKNLIVNDEVINNDLDK